MAPSTKPTVKSTVASTEVSRQALLVQDAAQVADRRLLQILLLSIHFCLAPLLHISVLGTERPSIHVASR